jgi:RHH-type rel operon transcriptional repressor/antitoxin RelB
VLGVRLDAETELALDAIARRTRRPKSQIAREAIRSYVLRNDVEARARAEWRVISDAERNDAETDAMLDAALRDLSADI